MNDSVRPMPPRDVDETHRGATPLELLFDLVSVIAIAAAAAGLHHAISANHIAEGIATYTAAFFGIWWAWMNYTWFASAYDNDDTLFRLLTMVIMAGALTMAAGIGAFVEALDLGLIVGGYVIMRLAMVALWLRASRHDPARRATTLWYAGGIALVQVYWVLLLWVQPASAVPFYALFALGAALELLVPVFAERHGITPWHRHHIIERYGLLTIIVLGETLLAGSVALQGAAGSGFDVGLIRLAVSALVILFAMWWLYFSREEHLEAHTLARALTWGYGHVLIFASGAAAGAGFAVLVDVATGHAAVGPLVGTYAVVIPSALYLVGLWFVRDRFVLSGMARLVLPVFSVLVLLAPLLVALEGIAVLMVLCVVTRNRTAGAALSSRHGKTAQAQTQS